MELRKKEESQRQTTAELICGIMAAVLPSSHPTMPHVEMLLNDCPPKNDISQPPVQLGAAMWPSSSLYNVSTSNLHVFQAGLAPCGTPLCSSPSAAKWGWHSHRTKGALVPESPNRGKPSANLLDEWEIECGKSLICGTYLLQHLLPNLPYPSSKAQKKGRSAQSQQRNHSYTEDGSMRLSFIISPPNDRRRFGAHTTLSFDCPCRLSIGTACGCILIAIFPCLVNMSLSFTGLKESPGEDVQSKKKRLGQNCGKTVKREMKKKS